MWGIDRLSSGQLSATRKRLRNGACAVLTHAAAVDRKGRDTLTVLEELGVTPTRLFSPEHGLDGSAQAEESVVSEAANSEGPDRVSLYGSSRDSLTPKDEHLQGIDTLLIDLVDVGSRYYTYVWTALLAARKAVGLGVHVVVLDRPNPITGDPKLAEGKPQSEGYLSFVGLEPIVARHGLTLGEILAHFLSVDGHQPGEAFSIVGCQGWERLRGAEAWGRPFVPPSPNMPSLETALLYPGGCLVEGTNLSEGRGTSFPFRVIGAPFLDGRALARELGDAHLPGVMVRPTTFKPSFEKHAGLLCHGVMLHVSSPATFRPITTYLTLLTLARSQAPESFAFRTDAYEFETEHPAFDLLTGSNRARSAMLDGASANDIVELVAPVGPELNEMRAALEESFTKALC
jgi:uncharacterized protein YbbC (DUF1343 family)